MPVAPGDIATSLHLHATDVNGDDHADILLYNPDTGVWYLARNEANGSFAYTSGTWALRMTIVTRTPVR